MSDSQVDRIIFIDKLRGVFVLLMIYTHFYFLYFHKFLHVRLFDFISSFGGLTCFTGFLLITTFLYGYYKRSSFKTSSRLLLFYIIAGSFYLYKNAQSLLSFLNEPIFLMEYFIPFIVLPLVFKIVILLYKKFNFIHFSLFHLIICNIMSYALSIIAFRLKDAFISHNLIFIFLSSTNMHAFGIFNYLPVITLGITLGIIYRRYRIKLDKILLKNMNLYFIFFIGFSYVFIRYSYLWIDLDSIRWPVSPTFLVFSLVGVYILTFLTYIFHRIPDINSKTLKFINNFISFCGRFALYLLMLHIIIIYLI